MASPSPCECARCAADSAAQLPRGAPEWVTSGGRVAAEPFRADVLALLADLAAHDVAAGSAAAELRLRVFKLENMENALPPSHQQGLAGLPNRMLPVLENLYQRATAGLLGEVLDCDARGGSRVDIS